MRRLKSGGALAGVGDEQNARAGDYSRKNRHWAFTAFWRAEPYQGVLRSARLRVARFLSELGQGSGMIRPMVVALLVAFPPSNLVAGRRNLPPADYGPLTSLPWKGTDATLDSALNSIFREPNVAIRYPVLGEYLRTIPVEQIGAAFDMCIKLEGTQQPEDLVALFLEIWAKRDPQACWGRVKDLFDVVGIEGGWLNYDSWLKRDAITVQSASAIRASPFYLPSSALKSFPVGVDQSVLAKNERVKILNEFAQKWFFAFGSWPGYDRKSLRRYEDRSHEIEYAFGMSIEQFRGRRQGHTITSGRIEFEIGMRRWLEMEPSSAVEVLKQAQEAKWPSPGRIEPLSGLSIELMMLGAKADLPAMIRWAETLEISKGEPALRVKGFLMSRVDAPTRDRWLEEAKSAAVDEDRSSNLIDEWARWDPKKGLEAAVARKDPELISDVADAASSGPWGGAPYDTSHFGLGVIKDFDVTSIPQEISETARREWYQILEQWGKIDIGETASYGFNYLLRTNYAPRARLIRLFSGHDEYPDEGDMIDRTFCALRVWAVIRPDEMKTWIGTVEDEEMRQALSWMLDHPWGTVSKE